MTLADQLAVSTKLILALRQLQAVIQALPAAEQERAKQICREALKR